jgi:hypothetical protein
MQCAHCHELGSGVDYTGRDALPHRRLKSLSNRSRIVRKVPAMAVLLARHSRPKGLPSGGVAQMPSLKPCTGARCHAIQKDHIVRNQNDKAKQTQQANADAQLEAQTRLGVPLHHAQLRPQPRNVAANVGHGGGGAARHLHVHGYETKPG